MVTVLSLHKERFGGNTAQFRALLFLPNARLADGREMLKKRLSLLVEAKVAKKPKDDVYYGE